VFFYILIDLTKTFIKDFKKAETLSQESRIMGEEKPDEELMGKRKSSPRLSTTFADVDMFNSASICNDLYM
jgi:hypothetical protein